MDKWIGADLLKKNASVNATGCLLLATSRFLTLARALLRLFIGVLEEGGRVKQ